MTAATEMLRQGIHPKVVADRLGHSTTRLTLDVYSHVVPALESDAAAKVDAAGVKSAAADMMDSGKDTTLAPGVLMRVYGGSPAIISGYKSVSMRDIIMQPGSKTPPNNAMKNDMVCHITEGELRIVQDDKTFTAKKNYAWTCAKGTVEQVFNDGNVVGIIRITDLMP